MTGLPIHVGIGEMKVGRAPDRLITHSLGSCIGITAHDADACIGGMLHFMLPDSSVHKDRARSHPAVYADTGIVDLFRAMRRTGAKKKRIKVHVVGGAVILDKDERFGIGQKNIEAAFRTLARLDIPVHHHEVGGEISRTLILDLASGQVEIRSFDTPDPDDDSGAEEDGMSEGVFRRLADIVYRMAGIHLTPNKRPLVKARLGRRIKKLGLTSFRAYLKRLDAPDGEEEVVRLLDAISTNQTSFFREPEHFDHLAKEVLPAVTAARFHQGARRLSLWSAGCSSGEEAYSMAMVLDRFLQTRSDLQPPTGIDARVLATDLNTEMVHKARGGVYDANAVDSVPPEYLRSCFSRISPAGEPGSYRIIRRIQDLVTVGRLNLMDADYPFSGPFDVIFLRNVVMYFSQKAREDLLTRISRYLAPWGYLFLGHAESIQGFASRFRCVAPAVYLLETGSVSE